MKRFDHRLDERGGCTRCGLSKWHAEHCPPGFWMTKLEAKTWDDLPDSERGAYERWLMGEPKKVKP